MSEIKSSKNNEKENISKEGQKPIETLKDDIKKENISDIKIKNQEKNLNIEIEDSQKKKDYNLYNLDNDIRIERNPNKEKFGELANENKGRFEAIINEIKTERVMYKTQFNNIFNEMKTQFNNIFKEMKKDRNENREKFDAIINEMETETKESRGRFDAIINQMNDERDLSKKQHDDLILLLKNKIYSQYH